MNINAELIELYATAKAAEKLDLAFRILACLAKMKPEAVSVEALSSDELTSIITECEVLSPKATKTAIDCATSSKLAITKTRRKAPLKHAHTQAKAQQGPPQ